MPPETNQISTRPPGPDPGVGPVATENTGVIDANAGHYENPDARLSTITAAVVDGGQLVPDELDVRSLPHGGRHEIIFAKLDQLLPGHTFVILNDHDPKPLRYQTEAQWPGRFAWSYLETGPLLWRVEITRAACHDLIDGLTRALARACRHLALAGQPERASQLAADGWVLLRHTHPVQAQRLDGTMHHVALLEDQTEATPQPHHREETTLPVTDRIVDVRTEIPRIRHQLIFETFASLAAGTAFVLVNDHDPKPLYYQLAAENAGEFSWDYLEEGPEVWRVRIGRLATA